MVQRFAPARTWPELEIAAGERFWDGVTLAMAAEPRATGAVYMLGYVAEMLLVASCLRVAGVKPDVDVRGYMTLANRDYRADYRDLYKRPEGNDHELSFWLFVLERRRVAAGEPIDAAFHGALAFKVATIAQNWSEMLRYRSVRASEAELWDVIEAVDWIVQNSPRLWS